MTSDPALILAEHVVQTPYSALPERARASSKRDILDTLGAAIGGSVAPGIDTLASMVRQALYRQLDLANAQSAAAIAEVVVTTNPRLYADQFAPGTTAWRPTQVVEAQFSLPFLIATALVQGRVGIADVANVDHPEVLALAKRIRGESAAAAVPGWARITIRCQDGRQASLETLPFASGSPEQPLSDAQLQDKFRDCSTNAIRPLSAKRVEQLIAWVADLDGAQGATACIHLLNPAAA